jgi:hypothetical protein
MELDVLLQFSQKSATGPYLDSIESCPHPYIRESIQFRGFLWRIVMWQGGFEVITAVAMKNPILEGITPYKFKSVDI